MERVNWGRNVAIAYEEYKLLYGALFAVSVAIARRRFPFLLDRFRADTIQECARIAQEWTRTIIDKDFLRFVGRELYQMACNYGMLREKEQWTERHPSPDQNHIELSTSLPVNGIDVIVTYEKLLESRETKGQRQKTAAMRAAILVVLFDPDKSSRGAEWNLKTGAKALGIGYQAAKQLRLNALKILKGEK
jgi:hypothetical protein